MSREKLFLPLLLIQRQKQRQLKGQTTMPNDSAALAAYDPNLAALGLDQGQPMKPSNLRLTQATDVGKNPALTLGYYRDEQSNMEFDTLKVTIIKISNGRVCYPPGSDRGEKPICRSVDGKLPVISQDLIRQDSGKGCAKCPMSRWTRDYKGRSVPPPCMETKNILLYDIESGFIFRYNAKKTAVTPVKDLQDSLFKAVTYAKNKTGLDLPVAAFVYELGTTKMTNPKGTYYIPKFLPAGTLFDQNKYPEGRDTLDKIKEAVEFFSRPRSTGNEDEDEVDNAINDKFSGGTQSTEREYEAA